jgi:outer membrane protein assembly factor BamB
MRHHLTLGVGCGLWLACAALAHGENWPGFRGENGDGVAEKQQAPTYFGPASNVLWKAELLRGHSSPIVWKDRAFLTGAASNKLTTICFDRLSGRKCWEQSVTVEKLEPVHEANTYATPTPVTDGKTVFVYFGSFGLVAYDLDGKELWRKPLPTPKTFFNQGTSTSLVLVEGKLVVFVQVGNDSHLLALNPADGGEVWKAGMPLFNNSFSTPVVWKEGGKNLVGIVCAQRFTAFAAADGKEAWWVDGLGYQACSTPVVVGDRLVITAAGVQGEVSNMTPPPAFEDMIKMYDRDGDGLIAFEEIPDVLLFTDRQTSDPNGNMSVKKALGMFGGVKPGDKLNRAKWEQIRGRLTGFRTGDMNRTVVLSVRTGGKEDVTQSQVLWKETKGVPEIPSPLVWRQRLYLIRSGGILVCRDLETGKLVYENRIDSPGGYFASPVLAGGLIYLASDRGTVTVVRAGDSFEVLARNELKEPIMASPVIVENTLLIRSAERLWALADQNSAR